MKKPESPCLNCQDRTKYCHVKCEKYANYTSALHTYTYLIKKKKKEDYDADHINSNKRRRK